MARKIKPQLLIVETAGHNASELFKAAEEIALHNIEKQKQASELIIINQKLQASYKEIQESEKRFRNVVEQAIHPILILKGEDLILELANEPLFKIWNVDSTALGKSFSEILPEMKDQPFENLLLDVLHNGVTHYGYEQPAYFKSENGEERIVYSNFVYLPYCENDGTVSGVIVQATDVTVQVLAKQNVEKSAANLLKANQMLELHMAEKEKRASELLLANRELAFQNKEKGKRAAELILANKELEIQNQEKARLILENKELLAFNFISSHDLQEPLRKIQMFVDRIGEKDKVNLSPDSAEHFARIQSATLRMRQLIDDLLDYSRIINTESKFEITDLTEIVQEVCHEFEDVIQEKKADIDFSELCTVRIIPFQFRQLMTNLISNAIKFTLPDTPLHLIIKSIIIKGSAIETQRGLLPEKDYCYIVLKDNGIGFDPQYKDNIFGMFQKLHARDIYAGTGIGLAIVRKIVDNHKGFIIASSEINQGAEFHIYIPIT